MAGKGILSALAEGVDLDDAELETDEEGDAGADMRRVAAEDAIAAIKARDAEALDDALGRHYEACAKGAGHGPKVTEDDEEEGY
jgi:hypothetical protein